MIKLTWDDLITRQSPTDATRLYKDWEWLISGRFRPVAWSKFGDTFIERETGEVQLLDVVQGVISQIASSIDEFYDLLNIQENQEDWLLSYLVWELHTGGLVPAAGQCYALKIHPTLGGKLEVQNIITMDMPAWIAVSGQLHQQAARNE